MQIFSWCRLRHVSVVPSEKFALEANPIANSLDLQLDLRFYLSSKYVPDVDLFTPIVFITNYINNKYCSTLPLRDRRVVIDNTLLTLFLLLLISIRFLLWMILQMLLLPPTIRQKM
jgi:hypothetical protein